MDAGMNNLINDHDNHWIPSPGYAWVSDGETWTTDIYLGASDSIDRWHGTNEEPPEPVPEEEISDSEALDIILGGADE